MAKEILVDQIDLRPHGPHLRVVQAGRLKKKLGLAMFSLGSSSSVRRVSRKPFTVWRQIKSDTTLRVRVLYRGDFRSADPPSEREQFNARRCDLR